MNGETPKADLHSTETNVYTTWRIPLAVILDLFVPPEERTPLAQWWVNNSEEDGERYFTIVRSVSTRIEFPSGEVVLNEPEK